MAPYDATTRPTQFSDDVIVRFDDTGFPRRHHHGVLPPVGEVQYAIVTSRFQPSSLVAFVTSSTPANDTSWYPTADDGTEHSTGNVVVKAVILISIMASAVVGNLLVVISVLCYDRLRRVANSFIVSLAFADLLVALLVMPFNASQVSFHIIVNVLR